MTLEPDRLTRSRPDLTSPYDAYLTDHDKASPDQYVSDVHDGVFATVIRLPDDHTTDVVALGAALTWRAQ